VVKRFEVYWANLDATLGAEMKKIRPVVTVSPEVLNNALKTVVVCPLARSQKRYPTRVKIIIAGKTGYVAVDQIRAIDKTRLFRRITVLSESQSSLVHSRLLETFK